MIKSDFSRKGIDIVLDAGTDGGYFAMFDPRALKQALLNLAANAADALAGISGPRVRLALLKLGGIPVVRVEDNGAGMDEGQMKNLFKPFNTTKKQGTGLGLVIVRKMVAKMGGEVKVTSVKDRGTTVDILLSAPRN